MKGKTSYTFSPRVYKVGCERADIDDEVSHSSSSLNIQPMVSKRNRVLKAMCHLLYIIPIEHMFSVPLVSAASKSNAKCGNPNVVVQTLYDTAVLHTW